ncbi:GntR family transcriptional regulator (plasmid) [Sinorhizobium meliloti]|nr:GntR family transcriptional regulator [Sinorhizobium meliloti]
MSKAVRASKPHAPRTVPPRGQASEIHRVLRDRICLLRYRPGELLVETELAAEFNVSRTPDPAGSAASRLRRLSRNSERGGYHRDWS